MRDVCDCGSDGTDGCGVEGLGEASAAAVDGGTSKGELLAGEKTARGRSAGALPAVRGGRWDAVGRDGAGREDEGGFRSGKAAGWREGGIPVG